MTPGSSFASQPTSSIRLSCRSAWLFAIGAAFAGAAAADTLRGPGGKCLGVQGDAAERSAVVLATCDGQEHQRWQLPAPGFLGPIVGPGGFCLDVDQASSADGTKVQLFGCHGQANQAWRHHGGGSLVGLEGKCLSIHGGSTSDGARAELGACHGGDNQNFLVEPTNAWSPLGPIPGWLAGTVVTGDPQVLYSNDVRGAGINEYTIARGEDGGRQYSMLTGLPATSRVVVSDLRDANCLFVATDGHLYRSLDGGRSSAGVLALNNKNLWSLVQETSSPDDWYALIDLSLFHSDDGGRSFTKVGDVPARGGRQELAIAANGDFYYFSGLSCGHYVCADGEGLFRSRDRGRTWSALPVPDAEPAGRLLTHPTSGEVLYYNRRGITSDLFRSDDAGATWTLLRETNFLDFQLLPATPDAIYGLDDDLLVRSPDRGQTWESIPLPIPPELPAGGFFYSSDASFGPGLRIHTRFFQNDRPLYDLESLDAGSTWSVELAPERVGASYPGITLRASPWPGRFYSWNGKQLTRSDDGGRSWSKLYHQDQVATVLFVDPFDAETLYLLDAPTQWVLRSVDGGRTFAPLPRPAGLKLNFLEVMAYQGHTLLIGAPYASSTLYRTTDGGATWLESDLLAFAPLLADGEVLYTWEVSRARRSIDGGAHWSHMISPPQGDFLFGLAAGGGRVGFIDRTERLHLSTDYGRTWSIRELPRAVQGKGLAIDAQGRLYLLHYYGDVFRSRDDGRTWERIQQGLPRNAIDAVVADPADPSHLLAQTHVGTYHGHFDAAPPLVLGDGRFEISLHWQDAQGQRGEGHATTLASEAGYFWLFTPNRAEVAIKLLDARPIDGRFWLFVASMSNVAFDLEVRDRASGQTREYHNPQGVLASFADTTGLPPGGPEPAAIVARSASPLLTPNEQVVLADRFEITAAWRDAAGQTGVARGEALDRETAGLYFFDRSNLELLINVIDGRALNGHYWVFYAGLSNVEYSITVRDRQTGATRTYHNPLGTFASAADTGAF